MEKSTNRKDFVCWNPYTYMEIHENGLATMCCPAWLPTRFNAFKLNEEWRSDKAWKVRKSIEDGNYKYCQDRFCPILTAIREGRADDIGIERVTPETFNWTKDKLPPLKHVKFCFDPTCNLACKTCREKKIVYMGPERQAANRMMEMIERDLAQDLELIDVSGSGEVFFSPTFRNWLFNMDPAKYPKLKNIHIHTNGQLWTELLWNQFEGSAKQFIHSAEISIDAASEKTYEAIRRGGSWKKLVDNLNFIRTIPLETITCSFVIQRDNYLEIEAFYEFIKSIFEGSAVQGWKVMYGRVGDWGRLTRDHWNYVNIFAEPEAEQYIVRTVQKLAQEHNNVITNI